MTAAISRYAYLSSMLNRSPSLSIPTHLNSLSRVLARNQSSPMKLSALSWEDMEAACES